MSEDIKVIKVDDNEDINVVEVDDNESIKNVALETLLKGPKGESAKEYMTYIDLSTDMENPTEMMDFASKGGTYVAKNDGFLGIDGEVFTALHQGQFFKVINFKDLMSNVGTEISDDDNIIIMAIPTMEGPDYLLMKYGNEDWQDAITINSSNINNYINIDTSNFITKNMVNSGYGTQIINNILAISSASENDINNAISQYKPITPNKIDYAVQSKGSKYFGTKEELKAVQDNVDKLITDIEAILDTVVTVNG